MADWHCLPGETVASNSINSDSFKASVSLYSILRCLASKQCSASDLKCKYLNPDMKLKIKAYSVGYYTIPKIFKYNDLSNFLRP